MRQIEQYFPRELLERYGSTVEEAGAEATKAVDGVLGRLEALTPEQLEQPVAPGKWTPTEVVDHLHRVTLLYLEGLEQAANGGQPERHERGFIGDDGALMALIPGAEPVPGRSAAEAAADLRASTARLIEAAGAAGSAASVVHVNPYFGELSPLGVVQMAALHARHHRKRHLDHLVEPGEEAQP
jgi:hypothetical protein